MVQGCCFERFTNQVSKRRRQRKTMMPQWCLHMSSAEHTAAQINCRKTVHWEVFQKMDYRMCFTILVSTTKRKVEYTHTALLFHPHTGSRRLFRLRQPDWFSHAFCPNWCTWRRGGWRRGWRGMSTSTAAATAIAAGSICGYWSCNLTSITFNSNNYNLVFTKRTHAQHTSTYCHFNSFPISNLVLCRAMRLCIAKVLNSSPDSRALRLDDVAWWRLECLIGCDSLDQRTEGQERFVRTECQERFVKSCQNV